MRFASDRVIGREVWLFLKRTTTKNIATTTTTTQQQQQQEQQEQQEQNQKQEQEQEQDQQQQQQGCLHPSKLTWIIP